MRHSLRQRQWFAELATPLPAPALVGIALTPVVPVFTWQSGASEERVRSDLHELPSLLDEVDRLLAGRPAETFASRVVPEYPRVPAALPAGWLP